MSKMSKINVFLLCFILYANSLSAFAFETDQYNLPPVPLADIGGEVSVYAAENIERAIGKINKEIVRHQKCLDGKTQNKDCGSDEKEKAKLKYLRSETAVVREVFKLLGDGFPPFTNSGTWMEKHGFKGSPARYKTSFGDSIFKVFPTDYLTISNTVNLYGAHLGTDKIAHIFQQGYTYFKRVEQAKAKGLTDEQALRKAINWGRMTEKTYYGILISGLFSNGDLAANFAGMKFYQTLTRRVKIGETLHPAILVLENGLWKFNVSANGRERLLKPFISDHLNEALNPSVFIKLFNFDSFVRETVRRKSCPQWREKFPAMTQKDFAGQTEKLKFWHGEDYGHKDSNRFITIADTCFEVGAER